jgi:hypothetical protein
MSFIEDEGMLRWECDGCAVVKEAPAEKFDFRACWSVLKELGWQAFRDEEGWTHYCRECVSKQKGMSKDLMSKPVGGST